MLSGEEIQAFQASFSSKYSTLAQVYAVADGLKIYLDQSGDCVIQNMFYNGWKQDHYVGNVFVFSPNGCIIACATNAPGSMHDSTIAEWGNVIIQNWRHLMKNMVEVVLLTRRFAKDSTYFSSNLHRIP